MIERYLQPEIAKIWEEKSKYRYFLQVELELLRHLEDECRIPSGAHAAFANTKINLDRIHELEKKTHHDVVAFCESITEQVDTKYGKYFHFGVTSSDIIDTALSLQIKDSIEIIENDFDTIFQSLEKVIVETKDILALGRSHGVFAEPMIFAQKFLGSYAEFKRRLNDIKEMKKNLTGQISGAVGNYSLLSPELEVKILNNLGLKVEDVSTQVIPRDHLAKLTHAFSLIACAIERVSTEIRHLHHEDINEAHEGFKKDQKGSSTMPHKKNPIATENLTGIARVIRSYVAIAEQNCILWHERDISHSSSERIYIVDMFGYTSYALNRLAKTLENLSFNKENIERKFLENPKVLSSIVLHKLISDGDQSREDAYQKVQAAAFGADPFTNFKNLLNTYNINFEFDDINGTKSFYQKSFMKKAIQVLGRQL